MSDLAAKRKQLDDDHAALQAAYTRHDRTWREVQRLEYANRPPPSPTDSLKTRRIIALVGAFYLVVVVFLYFTWYQPDDNPCVRCNMLDAGVCLYDENSCWWTYDLVVACLGLLALPLIGCAWWDCLPASCYS